MNIKLHERRMSPKFQWCFMGRAGMKATMIFDAATLPVKTCFLGVLQLQVEQPATQSLRALPKFNCMELFFFRVFGVSQKRRPTDFAPVI